MEIVIAPDGHIRAVYDEAIDLASLGQPLIERASCVEPTSDGYWNANLAPVGGPILGPFHKRSEALVAELEWLANNWL